MRISDWSSDVCSSDLDDGRPPGSGEDRLGRGPWPASHHPFVHRVEPERHGGRAVHDDVHPEDGDGRDRDRKSVVKGKSVSVRVDLGGRRRITKKFVHEKCKYEFIHNIVLETLA